MLVLDVFGRWDEQLLSLNYFSVSPEYRSIDQECLVVNVDLNCSLKKLEGNKHQLNFGKYFLAKRDDCLDQYYQIPVVG
jgi:hypothetical protein